MLSLPPNQIHLWFVFEDDVDDALLPAYRRMLAHDEIAQEQRFHFARDQRRYLITRALIRTVLSRYSPQAPEYWQFIRNEYGRPLLSNGDAFIQSVSFNLSHADGLILCGISLHRGIGVDVEYSQRKTSLLDVPDGVFSHEEAFALRKLSAHQQVERFFHYWTLKESFVKARGKGLAIPLDQVGFNFQDACGVELSLADSHQDFSTGSQFWVLQPSSVHVAAVCVERAGDFYQHIMMRKTVPGFDEEMFDCPVLWQSNTHLRS